MNDIKEYQNILRQLYDCYDNIDKIKNEVFNSGDINNLKTMITKLETYISEKMDII
jgi:hypothetical protein